jgi:glycosyltransferase involved in cell wall biosynthesis
MNTHTPLRVLCLDIEGGHGGSSRSLYESIRHLDLDAVALEVWCRREGPIQARYRDLGVPVRVTPSMPRNSALPRLSRNLHAFARAAVDLSRARPFLDKLRHEATARFDVIHLNHEALFPVARWLHHHLDRPLTMHIRTNVVDTIFARRQVRAISSAVDHLVFITENEAETFQRLGGRPRAASVIHNAVAVVDEAPASHPRIPCDGRFKIACLSNYSWARGLDRLADVAEILDRRGQHGVLFVMAGDMALTRSMPGLLGEVGRRKGTLADYVAARGLSKMFLFLGHVSEPETVLAACDALAKPSRENNPWGRDTLEALAMGKPVFACGRYARFVEDGVTGVLQHTFDAEQMADVIARLGDDRGAVRRLGEAGRERVRALCHGPARAAELLAVWRSVDRDA